MLNVDAYRAYKYEAGVYIDTFFFLGDQSTLVYCVAFALCTAGRHPWHTYALSADSCCAEYFTEILAFFCFTGRYSTRCHRHFERFFDKGIFFAESELHKKEEKKKARGTQLCIVMYERKKAQ